MDFNDYLRVLRRGLPLILVCALMGLAFALLTMPEEREVAATTSYQAEAALLLAANSTVPASYVLLYSEEDELHSRVAERLEYPGGAPAVASFVSVVKSETDPLILITAIGRMSGQEAADLANGFADELMSYIAEKETASNQAQSDALEKALVQVQTDLEQAEKRVRDTPNSPILQAQRDALKQRYSATYQQLITTLGTAPGQNLSSFKTADAVTVTSGGFTIPVDARSRIVLFGGLAVLLGLVAVLVVERVDPRMRTRGDMERGFGMATLAVVPRLPDGAGDTAPLAVREPGAVEVNVFRGLRSALHSVTPTFLTADEAAPAQGRPAVGNRVLLVTAAHAGAGVTTTVANLVAAVADTGVTTMAVDAHLREPDLTTQLDGGPTGLVDVVTRTAGPDPAPDLADVRGPSCIPGADVIGAGTAGVYRGADPQVVRTVVEAARRHAEITVIDGEPLLEGVQSLDLLPFVDGVVIVARAGRTTREDAARVASILTQLQAPCLGLVVVDAPPRLASWRDAIFQRGSSDTVAGPVEQLERV